MGTVSHKTQCPSCASRGGDTNGDNLIVYEDGGSFCFACGYTKHTNVSSSPFSVEFSNDFLGLRKEVLQKYKVFLRVNQDKISLCFPYVNTHGTVVKIKSRTFDNGKLERDFKFTNVGVTSDKHVPLFGYIQKLPPNLIIFEGERDLLLYESTYGIPDDSWHYMALPGTSNAKNAAIALGDYTGKIHLCFDDDEAGKNATKEFLAHKQALVNITPLGKDVSNVIERGETLELNWSVDDGTVKDSKEAFLSFLTQVATEPLLDLGEAFQEVWMPRKGMLGMICGASGSGKSFFVDWLVLKAISQQKTVLIHSLEMPPGELYSRLLFQLTGERLITEAKARELQPWFDAFDRYLKVNTNTSSIETIGTQLKANFGDVDIVVVDTISLFAKSLEWDKLITQCYALKQVALDKTLGSPMVLAVSQMSTKNVKRQSVTIDNLFGAAGLAHAPDYIQFMDTNDDGSLFFKVLKRDRILGQYATKNLRFDFPSGAYYEVTEKTNMSEENYDEIF
jgi:KaiC/GvpD/RAD55 family RecA-like ATPase